jgi:serine/threonine-protein kinase
MTSGTTLFGYRVLAKLGTGAASDIYAVQDPRSKQVWALKHVVKKSDRDDRFIEQVDNEHAVGSKLEHVNIRGTYKVIKNRKMFRVTDVGLLMELVDAASVDRRLPKNQRQAVDIFIQTARALAHMHSRGFVHADIKPTNILVTDDGTVKIIDLGQACPIGLVKKRIQGTPGYMAPEQAHRGEIMARTDIYNLGATMYWILVGEVIPTALPPKDDREGLYSGAIDAERLEPPVPPHVKNPRIHQLLSRQILECVAVDEKDRPESMNAVVHRLELIRDLLDAPESKPPPVVADEDTVF